MSLGGRSSANDDVSRANLGLQSSPNRQGTCKVRRKFYLWSMGDEIENNPFKIVSFHNPSRLKDGCSFSCCNCRPCLLGLAVEIALAAAQNSDA